MILFLEKQYKWLLFIICCIIFSLTYWATVETKNGDFTYSLLVSQAIIEHQTLQLDAYKDKVDDYRSFDHDYRIEKANGHYYYFLPLAPSVLSTPVVWVAHWLGQDMAAREQEYALLKLMAAVSCVFIFIIIYQLCACYLSPLSSMVLTSVSVLGTALVSSLGIALSSMNFAVIIILLSLLLIARYDAGRAKTINPYGLGLLLFLAFWCRPTTAPFIFTVFVYSFLKHRSILWKLALTSLIPFLLFLGWSWFTYGQLLPTFSTPDKLLSTSTFGAALYGNAFSPARGLLVFCPFLVLVVIGVFWFFRDVKRKDLFWFSLAWFGLYYILVARYPHWWDGHNYGPRVLTDGLPALILLTILLWREIAPRASLKIKTMGVGGYLTLGVVAIFINTYQGLYNPSTYQWNKNPNIDRYPEYLFDWRYPQFLASAASLQQRSLEHQQKRMPAYTLGNPLTYDSQEAVFWNWYEPETQWRWSRGTAPRIAFKLAPTVIDPTQSYILEILGGSVKAQKIKATLNDTYLGELTLPAFTGDTPATQTLTFSGTSLKENQVNMLDFYIPQAAESENPAGRTAGLAFIFLKIYPFMAATGGVRYVDNELFEAGFSHIEKGWRWTDDFTATVKYPAGLVKPDQTYHLAITAGALNTQTVEISLNGTQVGSLTFTGAEPQTHGVTFSGALLKNQERNKIDLFIPQAVIPTGDSRRLGLAFVSLKIYPVQ